MARNTKTNIMEAALAVLKEQGAEGLTVRKVAAHAVMSLGNLQYHFKDKSSLLAGMAEFFFGQCVTMLDDYKHKPDDGSRKEQVRNFILFFLDHVDHISDLCRLFRELWAIATRDPDIYQSLMRYYKAVTEKVTHQLSPFSQDPQAVASVVSLLMPYFEGYSINGGVMPLNKDEVADLLANLCDEIFRA